MGNGADVVPEAIRRAKDGRPYIKDPETGKEVLYSRVSTFAKAISDGAALAAWKMRMAYLGLQDRPDLMGRADRYSIDLALAEAMASAGANDAANMGTALHALSEIVDDTTEIMRRSEWDLPDSVWDALDRYVNVTKDLVPVAMEQFVVNDAWRVAGTFDRIFRLPDGRLVIGDLKTGKTLRMQEHAVQLAAYANSMRYDCETGLRSPLDVSTDLGLIVWIPADPTVGESRLVGVDLKVGWELGQLAQTVRSSRSRKVSVGLNINGEGEK